MMRVVAVWIAAFLTAQPSSRTITVHGRVVADDTGAPIRNARVARDPKADPAAVLTDAEGHFVLPAVSRQSQTLHASKTGYAASAVPVAADVEIRLQRAGVITGRVLDDFGEPLALIGVAVERVVRVNGGVQFIRHLSVDTDDTGAYRLFGLPAGEFVVGLAGGRVMLGNTTSTPMPGPVDATAALRTYYPDAKSRE